MKRHMIGTGVAVAALAMSVGACGGDDNASPDKADTYDVTLGDFSVEPASATTKAGDVTFSVTNGGAFEHEFVVMRASVADIDTTAEGEADEASVPEADHMGEVEHLKPGDTGTLTATLTPGHYVMFCNLSGDEGVHYKEGMHTEFDVTE